MFEAAKSMLDVPKLMIQLADGYRAASRPVLADFKGRRTESRPSFELLTVMHAVTTKRTPGRHGWAFARCLDQEPATAQNARLHCVEPNALFTRPMVVQNVWRRSAKVKRAPRASGDKEESTRRTS